MKTEALLWLSLILLMLVTVYMQFQIWKNERQATADRARLEALEARAGVQHSYPTLIGNTLDR